MKKIITYGTYDLFHEGHRRLLERAKALGDYLIVGVTTENYDESRGKLNVHQSLMERIENVKNTGLADEIIIEEYEGQKVNDIQKYNIDVFAIGSDWYGKFDYLKEYCDVIYLERTRGVSSTEIRNKENGIISIGVVGCGRIANRFVKESKYVSGVSVECVYGRDVVKVNNFSQLHDLNGFVNNIDDFLGSVDAVYLATPHDTHFLFAEKALNKGKHVLCEKPATLKVEELLELIDLAKSKNLVFAEAIKTAYCPGFQRLISVAKSGLIGNIVNVDATFTKLYENRSCREFDPNMSGGSLTELASYPLLAFAKLLGTDYKKVECFSYKGDALVDLFSKASLYYDNAIATLKVGLGVKSEGDLIISGTKGYVYVPSPWWLTEYFEVRFEDRNANKKYFYAFDGDGLRYEIAEFAKMIHSGKKTYKLTSEDSIFIIRALEDIVNKSK